MYTLLWNGEAASAVPIADLTTVNPAGEDGVAHLQGSVHAVLSGSDGVLLNYSWQFKR